MRNFKKLFAVIMAVAMLASIMVPALAADSFDYEAEAKKLYDLGLFKGKSETTYEPDLGTALTREMGLALMIRAMGKDAEVQAMSKEDIAAQLAKVVDKDKITSWAEQYVAYAVKNGLTDGIDTSILPNIKFGANLPLSGKEFIFFMMKAMGYTKTDVPWDDVLNKAADIGMFTPGQAVKFGNNLEIIRDDAVGIIAGAMVATTAGGVTLAQKLVDDGVITADAMATAGYIPEPTATPTPTPIAFAVDSVVTNNLKTVVVNFNGEIDKDSVTSSTMKITNKTVTAVVSDDKKSVTLVLADGQEMTQSGELELVIEGVKSLDKTMEVKGFKTKYTVADTFIPEVTGVEVVNAKQIDILVSEPMNFSKDVYQVLNNVKINGVGVIAKAIPDYAKNRIAIEFSTLKAAGTYSVEVSGLTDFAGYKALAVTKEITILADTTAPVMTNAEAKTLNEIEVTFDEAVPPATKGTFKVGSTTATSEVVAGSNNTKYKLTGFTLDLGAIVEVKITYKGQKDVVGNEVKSDTVYIFTVADDTTIPSVSAEVKSGNKVVVTFTKSMLPTAGTIKLYDKDNNLKKTLSVSDLTFKSGTNYTVLELSAASLGLDDVNPAKYKLNFKDMKDSTIRGNALPATDIEIEVLDTKKPTVTDTYLVTLGTKTGADLGKDDTITIYFSEAMDPDTAKVLSNYVIGGIAFSAIDGVSIKSFADDGKSIVITYPQARNLTGGGSPITVYAIKDLAGNMVVTNTNVVRLSSSTIGLVGNAEMKATNKVIVTYNTNIQSADPSVIKVQKNGTDFAVGIDASISDNKVTYTLDKDLDSTDTSEYTVVANNYNLVKNVYGSTFSSAFATQTITDKIRPEIKSVATYKVADVVQNNKIKVTFTEAVYEASANQLKNDLIIKDKDGAVIPDGKYNYTAINGTAANALSEIIITFTEDASLVDGAQDITVQMATERYIKDKSDNVIKASDVKTVSVTADQVNPSIVGYKSFDTNNDGDVDSVQFQFSEKIDDSSFTAGDFTFSDDNFTSSDAGTAISTNRIDGTTDTDADDEYLVVAFNPVNVQGTGAIKFKYDVSAGSTNAGTDLVGNKVADVDTAVEVADLAKPVYLSVNTAVAGGPATLTFSEAVTVPGAAGLVLTTDITGTVNGAAITAISIAQDTTAATTLETSTFTPAGADTQALVVTLTATGAGKIVDAAGNTVNTATLSRTDADIVD